MTDGSEARSRTTAGRIDGWLRADSALLFVVPAVILVSCGFVVPIGFVIRQAFIRDGVSVGNFTSLVTSPTFFRILESTFQIAALSTGLSVLLGYPLALCVGRAARRTRALLLTLIMVPFWTSILVKSYAFVVVLGDQGLFNQSLRALGLPAVEMIFNRFGVLVGMANYLVPFVVLIVLGNLLGQSEQLRLAAAVMGATKGQIFWRITLPASLPAVIGAVLICFVLSMGAFVVPALLGGRRDFMLANLMDFYLRETLNWGAACGLAVIVIAINGVFVLALGRTPARPGGEL